MAKPILIIRIPSDIANLVEIQSQARLLEDKFQNEYHVLAIAERTEKVEFEVLNSDNVSDIDIEKLKEEVRNSLNLVTNKTN